MNLIKKYKPSKFKDFIIDKSLENLLLTFIETNNINLLIKGDHGTGKTTLIDIILNNYYKEEYKCEKYKQQIEQNNIYKINSLNEQGVNFFRKFIKSFCQTMSIVPRKKKFVIIDEIDILNKNNQQILRSCIDKYGHKIHFISSCVNIQNVLDNIQSRQIIINLPIISKQQLTELFKNIIYKENIDINQDNLQKIMRISNFNINNIFNNIQKLCLLKKDITSHNIDNICTNINFGIYTQYLEYVKNRDIVNSVKLLNFVHDNGFSVNDILETFFDFIKYTTIVDDNKKFIILKLISEYIVNFYTIHEEQGELFLFTQDLIESIS